MGRAQPLEIQAPALQGAGTKRPRWGDYTAAGGDAPSPEALHWWEVYGTVRWAILCRYQAERHLSGADASIELAALGRRVCDELAQAIRDGSLDDRFDDVTAAVRDAVTDKLAVANPRHLATPGG